MSPIRSGGVVRRLIVDMASSSSSRARAAAPPARSPTTCRTSDIGFLAGALFPFSPPLRRTFLCVKAGVHLVAFAFYGALGAGRFPAPPTLAKGASSIPPSFGPATSVDVFAVVAFGWRAPPPSGEEADSPAGANMRRRPPPENILGAPQKEKPD